MRWNENSASNQIEQACDLKPLPTLTASEPPTDRQIYSIASQGGRAHQPLVDRADEQTTAGEIPDWGRQDNLPLSRWSRCLGGKRFIHWRAGEQCEKVQSGVQVKQWVTTTPHLIFVNYTTANVNRCNNCRNQWTEYVFLYCFIYTDALDLFALETCF